MADEDRQKPAGTPPAQPPGEDLVRSKRTVRAQVTNGALEARAYVASTSLPSDLAHKTFEMNTVAVDDQADPRRRATVARGMGEAVSVLEGDIVDPETGRVLPPVGADPGPDSPWLDGKRPTRLKGQAVPLRSAPPPGGAAASPGSRPGGLAYAGAAAIVLVGLAAAFWIGRTSAPTPDASAPGPNPGSNPGVAPPPVLDPAPPSATAEATAEATPELPAAPPAAPVAAPPLGAPPASETDKPSGARAPTGASPPSTDGSPPAPKPSSKSGLGGRIF
jgi:hypothetical protein